MSKLQQNVSEFMIAFGQDVMDTPGVPDQSIVRLRLRLIAEECMELMEAAGVDITELEPAIMAAIGRRKEQVDLVELADACADLDYVCEGTRLAFGIDGDPIAVAVHASNMEKLNGYLDEHKKWRKPKDWQPPDIKGHLIAQGWRAVA